MRVGFGRSHAGAPLPDRGVAVVEKARSVLLANTRCIMAGLWALALACYSTGVYLTARDVRKDRPFQDTRAAVLRFVRESPDSSRRTSRTRCN